MTDLTRATDAAARAWFDRQQAHRRDEGRKRPDGQPWQWEDLPPLDQHAVRTLVLPIVQAVLAVVEEDDTPRCPGCGESLKEIEIRRLCDPEIFVQTVSCPKCPTEGA